MSNYTNTMTTANQSAFAMPISGGTLRAFGTPVCAIQGIDVPVRDRHVAASLKGATQGTSVWRPPNC
ncbi:hypothetical protein [Nocardioides sp.]|uniref:hypothetical protein n=1 Tax=Nocardioides sp. TaxID=35761 RepID=UPI003D0D750D